MFECFKSLFKPKKVIPEPRKDTEGNKLPIPDPMIGRIDPVDSPVKMSDLPWKYPHNFKYVVDPDGGKSLLKTEENIPVGIVLHHTVTYNLNATVKYLQEHDVDVHFVIGKNGDIVQMVPCNRNAAHVGVSKWGKYTNLNDYFVGIEVVNIGPLEKKENGKYYDCYGQIHSGEVRSREVFGYKYWSPFTDKQEESLKKLVMWLVKTYKIDPKNVVGHYECSPKRKIDPIGGLSMTMDEFRNSLK